MKQGKRSIVSPERQKQLRQSDAVYVITCAINDCVCGVREGGCGRGFFSLFLQVIYGIDFSTRMGIPYHVDFGNSIYCYTDPQLKEKNFWNYFFIQPIPHLNGQEVRVVNEFHELFPLRIWSRSHFRKMHKLISSLSFTDEVFNHLTASVTQFKNRKVLGLQIRKTDHPDAIAPVKLETYLRLVEQNIQYYDRLFLATDDQSVAEKVKDIYGEKVITNTAIRSTDERPVHRNPEYTNRWKLGLDVLKDCYALAHCDRAILAHSNVSYAALLFNPEMPYILPERLSSKWKRLKTLSVYHLNEWGLRKW